ERQKNLGADGIWRFIFDAADLVRVKHGAIAIPELELYADHGPHREVPAVDGLARSEALVHFELFEVRGEDEIRALGRPAVARIRVERHRHQAGVGESLDQRVVERAGRIGNHERSLGGAVGCVDHAGLGIAGAEISGRRGYRNFGGTKNALRPGHEARKIMEIDTRARLASGQCERKRHHRGAVANATTIEAATLQNAGPSTKRRRPRPPRQTRPAQSIATPDEPSSWRDTTRRPPGSPPSRPASTIRSPQARSIRGTGRTASRTHPPSGP